MAQSSPHVMLVEARFYEDIADEMARGAIELFMGAGATYDRYEVPGAFEIPAAIACAVEGMDTSPEAPRFDGFVALGCVIRGETTHYDYVCQESARALMDLSTQHRLALGYGILTCENRDQAWARAAVDQGNKGAAAASACLHMIDLKRSLGAGG